MGTSIGSIVSWVWCSQLLGLALDEWMLKTEGDQNILSFLGLKFGPIGPGTSLTRNIDT